ncbi:hypothetical protein N7471_013427 [Penicillium samsonianum]|uniref:uncharacterized protein n=1 Tax=Penicillium samsonianum TaxID=1882272 RepID=UPI0025494FCC|nr:uncharacterized protein N7471_013427 [Penicillium samsonianum]KAJ6118807.1 hypothetical protein N7471_013427 [Penicillium samsonianum]
MAKDILIELVKKLEAVKCHYQIDPRLGARLKALAIELPVLEPVNRGDDGLSMAQNPSSNDLRSSAMSNGQPQDSVVHQLQLHSTHSSFNQAQPSVQNVSQFPFNSEHLLSETNWSKSMDPGQMEPAVLSAGWAHKYRAPSVQQAVGSVPIPQGTQAGAPIPHADVEKLPTDEFDVGDEPWSMDEILRW